jgi:glycosyltransferase involved in cell wall biosynthesis
MVSDFYPPAAGGVEHHVHNLSHALSRRGHQVTVATLQWPGTPAVGCDGEVQIRRIRTTTQRIHPLFSSDRMWAPPVPDPEAVSSLRAIIREARPDVVHGHDWLTRSFLPLKRWSRAALVVTLHYFNQTCAKKSLMYRGRPCSGPSPGKCIACAANHYGRLKGPAITAGNWLGSMAERALVDRFIAVSQDVARGNNLDLHQQPVDVIPNFIADHDPAGQPLDDAYLRQLPCEEFILFVGDLRVEKGVSVLLEAYAGLDDAPPLALIGKAWPDAPKAFPPRVHALGEWPHAAVLAAWERCLFGVVPSVWPEPFGMVLIEAMSRGKPVIASRIGGIPEVVVDGETALLIPPGDPHALRDAMERLIQFPELRDRMGRAAFARSLEFREAVVVPRIVLAYESAIQARH